MRRTRLLCVLGVILWSAVAIGQSSSTTTLSPALRTHLQTSKFELITSIRGLPLGVRDRLQMMFGRGTLDIAEPGAEFQVTDVIVKPNLPIRRMISAGCTRDFYCLLYYERGGIAHTWYVTLFRWSPDETRFEWGGAAPGGLKTIEDVRKAIVSGSVKGQAGPW